MFQFTMSVDIKRVEWLNAIEKVLLLKARGLDCVLASKQSGSQIVSVSVACSKENKDKALAMIKDAIVDMFLTVCKRSYLANIIKLPQLSKESYKILIHTLVAFDTLAESEIIKKELVFNNSIALDGFFNFRLSELKTRWNDISYMVTNNSCYITNDETLNELLKFLLSAVSPKIKKINITVVDNEYMVSGNYNNSDFMFNVDSSQELLLYLINVAPIELTIQGDFADRKLYKQILSIFDGKLSASLI